MRYLSLVASHVQEAGWCEATLWAASIWPYLHRIVPRRGEPLMGTGHSSVPSRAQSSGRAGGEQQVEAAKALVSFRQGGRRVRGWQQVDDCPVAKATEGTWDDKFDKVGGYRSV